jgi:hypothetical protein
MHARTTRCLLCTQYRAVPAVCLVPPSTCRARSSTENLSGGGMQVGDKFQLERLGYFVVDPSSTPAAGGLVLNRTVTLRDSFPKK